MLKKIINSIENAMENILEELKDKEYVCYYNNDKGNINEIYLTKKELYKFINKHQLADMRVYKIKDRVEIVRELSIKENNNDDSTKRINY